MKNTIIDFIIEHWAQGIGLSAILLELIMRLFPTRKDWSLLNKIFTILNVVIPNLERDPQTGKIKRKRNIARVIIFFVLGANLGNYASAQNPVNTFTKGIFSYNASDTAFLQASRTSMQNLYGNTGGMYFDKTRNKWRIWSGTPDSAWVDLLRPVNSATIGGSIATTQVAYGSGVNTITGEAAFVYNEATNTLTATNFSGSGTGSFTTSVTSNGFFDNSYVSGGVNFFSGAGEITSEGALTYDATLNRMLLLNPAGAFTLSIFGGEIQFDDIAGGDDCTINDEGIQFSGSVINEIATDSDLQINVTDDLFLVTAPDAGTTANEILTRDTSTGEIEVVSFSSVVTSNMYTPSYNIVANIDAITVYNLSYLNIGNYYQVSGQVGIDPTSNATLTSFEISIPVAGTVVDNSAGGTGCNSTNACFSITEDTTQLQATFTSETTANEIYNFTVGYTLIGI